MRLDRARISGYPKLKSTNYSRSYWHFVEVIEIIGGWLIVLSAMSVSKDNVSGKILPHLAYKNGMLYNCVM